MDNQPRSETSRRKFIRLQSLYSTVTIILFTSSILLLIFGYILRESIETAAGLLFEATFIVFVYHPVHFLLGLILLFTYLLYLKKRIGQTKITKTIISLLITPVSFFLTYLAGLFIILSSCSV